MSEVSVIGMLATLTNGLRENPVLKLGLRKADLI